MPTCQDRAYQVTEVETFLCLRPSKDLDLENHLDQLQANKNELSHVENLVLCYIATNTWWFQGYLERHIAKDYERCLSNKAEDVNHYLWSCPEANNTWRWVQGLILATSSTTGQHMHLTMTQALLGESIEDDCAPHTDCGKLCVITLWFIWIGRNSNVFLGPTIPQVAMKAKSWAQLKHVLQIEWDKELQKVNAGKKT